MEMDKFMKYDDLEIALLNELKPSNFIKYKDENGNEVLPHSETFEVLKGGSNGRVAKWTFHGKLYFVKWIGKENNQNRENEKKEKLRKEAQVISQLNNSSNLNSQLIELDDEITALVLDYFEHGSLAQFLKEQDNLKYLMEDENNLRIIFQDILEQINCLHQNNIVHCDIKCENVLIKKDENGKYRGVLIDFGETVDIQTNINCIGSPMYMSPEVVKGKGRSLCDIWSFGAVICAIGWAISTQQQQQQQQPCGVFPNPWHQSELKINKEIDPRAIMFQIALGRTPKIPGLLSHELQQLIPKCFLKPEERPTAEQLLQDLNKMDEESKSNFFLFE